MFYYFSRNMINNLFKGEKQSDWLNIQYSTDSVIVVANIFFTSICSVFAD